MLLLWTLHCVLFSIQHFKMQGNNFVSIDIPVELVCCVSVHIELLCALLEEILLKYNNLQAA